MKGYTSEWLADYERKHGKRPDMSTHRKAEKRAPAPTSGATGGDKDMVPEILKATGLPLPEKEHRFHPKRKWRFDYAWPDYKVALEVEGGAFTQGRHTRGTGFVKDMEKYNAAAALGWVVVRAIPQWVKPPLNGQLIDDLSSLFTIRKAA